MRKTKKLIILSLLIISHSSYPLTLLLTAALAKAHYNFRKRQYLKSFEQLLKFGYGPEHIYIVEALKKHGPSFLDDYSHHVFYATTNNAIFKNNGINEALTMREALYHFNFDPEEMILKLTGRHHFVTDTFIRIVENNQNYDAIVKLDGEGNAFTLCFAMKNKYLLEMINSFDFQKMEREWIILEHAVGRYIREKVKQGNFKVLYVDKLHVFFNTYGSTTAPGAPATHLIY